MEGEIKSSKFITMKFYCTTIIAILLFSSCLKQSIPDAMLGKHKSGAATLNCEINGSPVRISVNDADNQNRDYYTLGCSKSGYYILDALTGNGELTFSFYTDSLTTGNYKYTGNFGDNFITDYNNSPSFVHNINDSMSFNITSYTNGHISGNFSGQLTPLISSGSTNIWGTPGSVLITNGSFENVPVFY